MFGELHDIIHQSLFIKDVFTLIHEMLADSIGKWQISIEKKKNKHCWTPRPFFMYVKF